MQIGPASIPVPFDNNSLSHRPSGRCRLLSSTSSKQRSAWPVFALPECAACPAGSFRLHVGDHLPGRLIVPELHQDLIQDDVIQDVDAGADVPTRVVRFLRWYPASVYPLRGLRTTPDRPLVQFTTEEPCHWGSTFHRYP